MLCLPSALRTAQGGGKTEEGELKRTSRKNKSAHFQIHLLVDKQLSYSSLLFQKLHTTQNKAFCGASQLLLIVRYELQKEGELRGVVLHKAGIRDGSAPGCLPNPSENLIFPGATKDAFLQTTVFL